MNKALVTAIVMLAFAPAGAIAQERAGDAALGAVSGAVVLGPIGALAGAVVGYTAGPSIARSWGLRGSRSATYRQRPRGEANRVPYSAPPTPTSAPSTPTSAAPAPVSQAREADGRVAQMGPANNPPVEAAPAPPKETSTPPVQGFD